MSKGVYMCVFHVFELLNKCSTILCALMHKIE